MKKNITALLFITILALTFLSACKSSERCEAYRDSRANQQQTINQFHSRG